MRTDRQTAKHAASRVPKNAPGYANAIFRRKKTKTFSGERLNIGEADCMLSVTYLKLEMRSVERGICTIATSIMNELFQ